jgi:hypothetical protein
VTTTDPARYVGDEVKKHAAQAYFDAGGLVDAGTPAAMRAALEAVAGDIAAARDREYQHVGWMGPYGIVPGGLDVDPAPHWRKLYIREASSRPPPTPTAPPTCGMRP